MVKLLKYTLPVMAGTALLLSSCAEDPVKDIKVNQPSSLANKVDYSGLAAVKDVLPSKSFACDVAVSDLKGTTQIVAVSNFAEIEAPAQFNMNACVSADGSMSFSDVKAYIKSASDLGLAVYGADLVSNATINKDYLAKVQKGPITRYQEDSTYTLEPSADNYILTPKQQSIIENGDLSDLTINKSFVSRVLGNADVNSTISAGGPEGKNTILVSAKAKQEFSWDNQFFIQFNDPVKKDSKVVVSFWGKSSVNATVSTQTHSTPGNWMAGTAFPSNLDFTTSWKKFETTITSPADNFQTITFNLSELDDAADYYFADFTVEGTVQEKSINYDQVNNGDAEGKASTTNAIAKIAPDEATDVKAPIEEKVGVDGSKCYVVKCPKKVSQTWDTQFWIVSRNPLKKGDKIHLKYDYKASKACSASTGEHSAPGSWLAGGYATINFTTDWQTFDQEIEVNTDGAQSWAFDLSQEDGDVTFYFDNISLVCETVKLQSGTFTKKVWREKEDPLTKEQKDSAVNAALTAWITGMMDATDGKVTSWDAVSDPFAAVSDGAFDFKNYFGDEFVPTVLKIAKEQFKGEDKSKLKLFVAVKDAQDAANLDRVATAVKTWDAYGINAKFNLSASDIAAFNAAIATLEATGKPYRITINSVAADDTDEAVQAFAAIAKTLASASKLDGICFSQLKSTPESFTLWNSDNGRTAVYEAFVKGLQGK